eukprot:COSAG01_NODE_1530_length_9964_cov_5.649879_5_plen_69_part_00
MAWSLASVLWEGAIFSLLSNAQHGHDSCKTVCPYLYLLNALWVLAACAQVHVNGSVCMGQLYISVAVV